MTLHRDALIRYSRQLRLPELGLAGQERLAASRVLIVGAGGLGSGAAPYLAASGVGELIIADADTVELSNLHRQLLHTTADVGRRKVDSARARLEQLNPEVRITPLATRLDADTLRGALAGCDAVVDGSDNFATRSRSTPRAAPLASPSSAPQRSASKASSRCSIRAMRPVPVTAASTATAPNRPKPAR